MTKKILSILMCLCLVLSSLTVSMVSVGAETYGDFEYEVLYDGTVEIVGYTGSATTLEIPAEIDGKVVTSIGSHAFYNCESLTSVTIPDSITSIGYGAFCNCESLTSITIPDSVTSIGDFAFYNTGYYNNKDNWENNVLYIGNYLIKTKTSISGEYTIKDWTKVIADNAFDDCRSLTSVTIPDSITSIGGSAFYNCKSLRRITIGNSVTSIGWDAFDNTGYYNNEDNWENNVLYIGNYLINAKTSISGSYTIKDGTKVIADNAFYNCSSLTSVTIPDSVTSIGGWAFSRFTSLTSINVDENNENYCDINGILFNKDKTKLIQYPIGKTDTSYTIPDSVTSIGWDAFCNCESLTSITIPDSVTSIGDGAFWYCESLRSIKIPDSVTSIGRGAFYNCKSLRRITIGNSVTSIGDEAFHGCNIKELIIADGSKQVTSIIVVCESTLEKVTIPDSVTSIGSYAFEDCESLTSIIIGNSVTSIGDEAFHGCESLRSIKIPDSVTSIGSYAFEDCESLTSIIIGNSVTSIGGSAFYGCRVDLIIYGYTNSEAERYAINSGITFVSLGEAPIDPTTPNEPTTPTQSTAKPTATTSNQTPIGPTKPANTNVTTSTVKATTTSFKAPKVKAKASKGKIILTLKKVKGTSGYQVRYKVNGKWKVKTFKIKKNATKVIKKLKKGSYKVQIRLINNAKKPLSNWSKAKTVIVK